MQNTAVFKERERERERQREARKTRNFLKLLWHNFLERYLIFLSIQLYNFQYGTVGINLIKD